MSASYFLSLGRKIYRCIDREREMLKANVEKC